MFLQTFLRRKNMKPKIIILVVSVIVLLSFSLYSQQGPGTGPPDGRCNKVYDVNTVVTINGEVKSIDKATGKGNSTGVHLILSTTEGEIYVPIGPEWYLTDQSLQINVNDMVTVTGSKVTSQMLIAKEVVKGVEVLKLRDESGTPLWRQMRYNK
jgi:hypothetical protein